MEHYQYFFQELHLLTDVDIFCYRNGKLTTINEGIVHNSFPERVNLQKN